MNRIVSALVAVLLWSGAAIAAPHYVNVSCQYNGTGHAANCAASAGAAGAWNAASYANSHTYDPGDDLYLRDGVTISGVQITPGLNGTSSDQAILGSYYSDNGDVGKPAGGAVINGNNTVPSTTLWNSASLVNFSSRSYVTVQDLRVLNSGGRGIQFDSGVGNRVLNNFVSTVMSQGIRIGTCSRGFTVSNNRIEYASMIRTVDYTKYSAGIAIVGNGATACTDDSGTVSYNTVYRSHGEGIDVIKGRHNIVVEYNKIINSRSGNLYFSQNVQFCTARYNFITSDPSWGYTSSGGLCINDEGDQYFSYAGTESNEMYGNVVIGGAQGAALRTQHSLAVLRNTKIFNNTFIDNTVNLLFSDGGPYENSSISNNIFWITGQRAGCSQVTIPDTHTGLTLDHNYWSSAPSSAAMSSTDPGYPTYSNGDPQLNDSTINYASLNATTLTGAEFALTSSSTALINAGADQGTYNLLNLANSNWNTGSFQLLDADTYTPWDIGASIYQSSSPPPPTCGDGSCNGSETCSTCQADCGACPADDPDLTGVTFWADLESATIYKPTGGSWTTTGTVNYNTSANFVGTNGVDLSAANSGIRYTLSNDTIANDDHGSMAFWVRFVNSVPTGNIIKLVNTADSNKRLYVNVTSGNFGFSSFDGTNYIGVMTDAGGITTGQWYGVVCVWDDTANTKSIYVYNSSGGLIDSATSNAAWALNSNFNRLEVGTVTTVGNCYFDRLVGISTSKTTDWATLLFYDHPPMTWSCGNGTPESWENCATCPEDWGECPTPYPDVTLVWDMESLTLNTSAGAATTATLVGSAAISSGANKVGTNGLDVPAATSYANIALENGTIAPTTEANVGVWIYYDAYNTSGIVWNLTGPGGRFYVSQLASGELRHNIYDGTTYYSLDTDDADLVTGNWYYIVAKMKQSASDRFIGVYDVNGNELDTAQDLSTAFNAPTQAYTALQIGGTNAVAVDARYDGVIVSKDYATDLLALRDTISTPTPDPGDIVAGFRVNDGIETIHCTVAGGCSPTFTYHNTGTGLTSCTWVWGDGTSNLEDTGCDDTNITHDYAASGVGVRSVSLTITNGSASNTMTLQDVIVVGVGSELAPPTLSIVPSDGALVPTGTTLGVTTTEDATCKWDTSNVAYGSMANTFDSDDYRIHTSSETLGAGESDTYYVACNNAFGTVSGTSTWTARRSSDAWYAGTDGDFNCATALPGAWIQSGDKLVWGSGCLSLDAQALPADLELTLDCDSCQGAFVGPSGGMNVRIGSFTPTGDVQIGGEIGIMNKRLKRGGVTLGYVDDPNYWWLSPAITPLGNDEYLPGFVWHAPTGE